MSESRNDRRITLVVILSVLVVAFLLVGTPYIINTANTTEEVQRGNDTAACRSEAGSAVTAARTRLDVGNARLNVLVSQVIQAAVEEDRSTLTDTSSQLPAARQAVTDAQVGLRESIDRYRRQLDLSRTDPETFLALCE